MQSLRIRPAEVLLMTRGLEAEAVALDGLDLMQPVVRHLLVCCCSAFFASEKKKNS